MSKLVNKDRTSPSALIFWSVVPLGIVLRVWLSSLGHNYDLESYWEVFKIVLDGKSVYSETARYNYGPIWFLILGALGRVTLYLGYDDIFHFHVLVGSFLTLIDVVIALFLRDKYGVACSMFFLINPVSILITGYHSQFDSAAILLGLLACSNLATSGRRTSALRSVVMSALVLGLSLATKHILIIFPLWLWWLYRNSSGSIRTAVLVCSYGCFGAFFIPYLLDSSSIAGIVANVLKYGSTHGNSLIERFLGLFVDIHLLENSFGLALSRALFVVGTVCAGGLWISRLGKRSDERDLFFSLSHHAGDAD
ncbi:MAG: hypothetical protein GYA55_02525 [SAR324 cluster bacterium]|uniref:Glycosyltransferase RgtA/B/C/D-like domain-containing protein n=1 Tax=SAR324 cluster bacterium TaxID=2024889 RepID=A0A7X9IIG4_9DELT|nr:hypothetical protein [SAR324 cluster bacterium]